MTTIKPMEIVARILFLDENLDPDQISKTLNASATHAGKKGDARKDGRSIRSSGHWALYSSLSCGATLLEHWADLLSKCGYNLGAIREMSLQYDGMVVFSIKEKSPELSINIPRSMIDQIHNCGLQLEIEVDTDP